MARTRLTNAIRDSILKDLLVYAFKERAQAQYDAERKFVEEVWDVIFGEQQAKIDKAPSGWFGKDDDFKVAFSGEVQQLHFGNGFSSNWSFPWKRVGVERVEAKKRSMPYSAYSNSCVINFDASDVVTTRFRELQKAAELLWEEIDTAERTAKTTLSSCSSISKLIDVWPEARVFAEKYLVDGEQKALLPAIPREKLNTALNLPPEDGNAVAGGTVVA